MQLSRYITILTLVLLFASSVPAQQIAQAEPVDPAKAELAKPLEQTVDLGQIALVTDKVPRRTAIDNLFKSVPNPFTDKTEKTEDGPVTPKPQALNTDHWHFQLTPYLWVVGISGRVGIGNLTTGVDTGVTNDNVDLNFGFMATFEARKNRFAIVTDLQYSNIGSDHATPGPLFSTATFDIKTFVLDPEVGFRLVGDNEKDSLVDIMGGFRYWHLSSDLTFNAGLLSTITASRSRSWVDGVVGIRGKTHLTKRLFISGKLDAGGGGSNFTYQVFAGAGLTFGKRYALIGGYRDLNVNYNKDGFLFDTSLKGAILGLGIKF
jgi:hypothetical protein